MILYISPDSIASETIARELEAAMKRKEYDPEFAIIPVHIGGSPISVIVEIAQKDSPTISGNHFTECFGRDNRVLFIPRDVYPSLLTHISDLIDTLSSLGIVESGRVYDSFAYEIKEKSYVVITKYQGFSETVEPPSVIAGYPAAEIGDGAFAGNENLIECIEVL